MLADQTSDSACVDWSPVGSLTQREAALPSGAQRLAPLLFVSNTLASASGVNPTETAMAQLQRLLRDAAKPAVIRLWRL